MARSHDIWCHSHVPLVHLHRSAWALSWERRAPARLQKPRWSVALPAKALTQDVLCKCTRPETARSTHRQATAAIHLVIDYAFDALHGQSCTCLYAGGGMASSLHSFLK